jgi:hypothetical protein
MTQMVGTLRPKPRFIQVISSGINAEMSGNNLGFILG